MNSLKRRKMSRGRKLIMSCGAGLFTGALLMLWGEYTVVANVLAAERFIELDNFSAAPAAVLMLILGGYVLWSSVDEGRYQWLRATRVRSPIDRRVSLGGHLLIIGLAVAFFFSCFWAAGMLERRIQLRGFDVCMQTDHHRTPRWLWVHQDHWALCLEARARRGLAD